MSLPATSSRLRAGAAVAVPVILGAALAVTWVFDQRAQARERADADLRATVASGVTIVRTDLRNQLAAALDGSPAGQTVIPAARLSSASISTDIAVTARDTGSATLDDTVRPPSIVAPIYRGDTVPTDTRARRNSIVAYRVVALSMQPVLSQLVPDVGGLSVVGPNRVIASNPTPAPTGARTYAVDMDITGSPGWDVQAWRLSPGVPAAGWFGALLLLLLGGAAGIGCGVLVRREHRAGARARQLERDRAVVTDLAPLLQTSLDIAEVIPAVCSHLAGRLGLAGLSMSTPSEAGSRQLFVWGTTPDSTVSPQFARPNRLDRGESLAIPLTRAGRALGTLRVIADEPLEEDQLVSLSTAAEMLGSTLANAEAFAKQQDMLGRMRSVDELKTVFLATASHELRTPVTAIVGFTTLLLDQWQTMPTDRARGLVDRVMSNGRRLDALIEQLLDFSRLERGLPQASDEVVNLAATVSRILGDDTQLAGGRRLRIEVENECLIRASSSSLERIVTNVVGNAAKYSPSGSRITVMVRAENDRAAVIVDDEGPGVPEADRERIFSRFYRGRGDSIARTRGAGIGLAIVAEYVSSMSGTVVVEDAPGGGARFRVSFPIVAVLPAAAAGEGRRNVAIT